MAATPKVNLPHVNAFSLVYLPKEGSSNVSICDQKHHHQDQKGDGVDDGYQDGQNDAGQNFLIRKN